MNYSYTTLPEYWNTVCEFFEENYLYLEWFKIPYPNEPDTVILTTRITDLEDDSFVEDKMPIRLSSTDFRANGAAVSYWRRMSALSLSGLIDDEDSETFGIKDATVAPSTRSESGKKKRPTDDDDVIY